MSFFAAFTPLLLLMNLAGTILGIIWGALPGLSTTMAMALLVGLSFQMPYMVAIVFMLGVYNGSVFGGSISAILINIPGTPAAIPTQMAGHPLAKQGQGGLAIGVSITSSMLGNWAGIITLALLSPLIIKAALQFSSWEFALLAFWGVIISGSLMTGDELPIKGWIAGILGMLFAMIGSEQMFGAVRFTFGNRNLYNGLSYVAVLIGLFGLTEMFTALPGKQISVIPEKIGKVFPPVKLMLKYWKSILMASGIGLFTGIVPGAGSNVGSYVAYGIGEKMTKRKFSRGDMEGVVCSEVANNANIGGALLPGLTLGIPGSAAVAAFMAAMALHGIHSGPLIERNNPGILPFIYGALFITNIFMYIGGFALIKPSVKFFSTPKGLLFAVIGLICIIGAYSGSLSMFDVYVTAIFGVFGLLLRKADIPVGSLVLGVILGGMVDTNFRRTMVIYESRALWNILIDRPIGTVILIVIIVTFIIGFRKTKTLEDK